MRLDCVPNRSKDSFYRIHYGADNCRYRVDCTGYFFFDSIPDCNNDFFAVLPDKSKWKSDDIKGSFQNCCNKHNGGLNCIFDAFPQTCEEVDDSSPKIYKEITDTSPYFIPACTEPAKYNISNITNDIHIVGKRILDKVPYRAEYSFDTFPYLRPVTGEYTDKDVK